MSIGEFYHNSSLFRIPRGGILGVFPVGPISCGLQPKIYTIYGFVNQLGCSKQGLVQLLFSNLCLSTTSWRERRGGYQPPGRERICFRIGLRRIRYIVLRGRVAERSESSNIHDCRWQSYFHSLIAAPTFPTVNYPINTNLTHSTKNRPRRSGGDSLWEF